MTRLRRNRSKPHAKSLNAADIERIIDTAITRRFGQAPSAGKPRVINQDALYQHMVEQQAPAKRGTPMFSPGAPLQPSKGLVLPDGPRTFSYGVGYNIAARPRSTEATGFDTLRNFAMLYDGVQLCEQVWLDTVAKLSLVIKPRPEIIAEQGNTASSTKYADKIRQYTDILSYPDPGNGYDLKTWLRTAVRDQLQIDAVGVYVRRNKAGGVYSLEIVDGSTIKPLLDPRGRRPIPPYPAYQQFLYGVPAGLYTSDEMIYLRETTRTESIYGLSRVERIIMRVNQALRKQNKDLARFTDGNVPAGFLEPPDDGSQWTPELFMAYQEMWDGLFAGNDQARSRIKVVQPGSKYTATDDQDIFVDFDRFLLNVTTACYSMTMADLGFTESVNKSSGDSQENVFYRRAVQPLMDRYAQLFTQILRVYFDEQDLIVTWGGFEEAEDFNKLAESYVKLVGSGIIGPTAAARQMKLPTSGPDIPPYVIVPGQGIVFVEDQADPAMRKAANDAKRAGYEMAKNPPMEPPNNDAQAAKSDDKQRTPPGSEEKPKKSNAQPSSSGPGEKGSASPTRSGDFDGTPTLDGGTPLHQTGNIERSDDAKHTGIMIAFMIKPDVASQLALPGGEPAEELHCTLAYLGEVGNGPVVDPDKLGSALTNFAGKAQALQGKVGGIARFAPSEQGDDLSPVIALVNCPGLQEWRRNLVEVIEGEGLHVAKDFDFTPHITLAYIDPDDPMPADDVPVLPLVFDELCLAIGDKRSYFPLNKEYP